MDHPHRLHYRTLMIVAFLALCLLGLGLVTSAQLRGMFGLPSAASLKVAKDAPTPTPKAYAKFKVIQDPSFAGITSGQKVEIVLSGDSGGGSVQGFDALLEITGVDYAVEAIKAPDFDTVKFIKPTHLTISAVKALGVDKKVIFTGGEVLRVTLVAQSSGALKARVIESVGRETSKMIYDDGGDASGLQKVSATAEE